MRLKERKKIYMKKKKCVVRINISHISIDFTTNGMFRELLIINKTINKKIREKKLRMRMKSKK